MNGSSATSPRTALRRPRVLCVDDEPAILEALRDQLRRGFDVGVADNGADALTLLKREPDGYAVVISDMRMPGMSGSVVLREAKRIAPLTVRILLTGYADTASAMRAVNDGQIFRFLSKPCPADQLQHVCAAAVGQHRLLTAERRVLEHAQFDMIDALTDLLAAGMPETLARRTEFQHAVASLAREARGAESREAQLAAKLIGLTETALPEDTALRLPQLASVLEIVRTCRRRYDSVDADGPLPEGAQMLRVVADYAELRDGGADPRSALASLRRQVGVHDPDLLDALARTLRHD